MPELARNAGMPVEAYFYDYLLGREGTNLILYPYTNYTSGTLDEVHEMLSHPAIRFGLGDAGAHCGMPAMRATPRWCLPSGRAIAPWAHGSNWVKRCG